MSYWSEDEEYVLSHYPLPVEWGFKNIHGHVHNNVDASKAATQVCISVENIGYSPIRMSEVIKRFKTI